MNRCIKVAVGSPLIVSDNPILATGLASTLNLNSPMKVEEYLIRTATIYPTLKATMNLSDVAVEQTGRPGCCSYSKMVSAESSLFQ